MREQHKYMGYSNGKTCYICGESRDNKSMHPPGIVMCPKCGTGNIGRQLCKHCGAIVPPPTE